MSDLSIEITESIDRLTDAIKKTEPKKPKFFDITASHILKAATTLGAITLIMVLERNYMLKTSALKFIPPV